MIPGLRVKLGHFLIGLTIFLIMVPLMSLFLQREVYALTCTWNGSVDNNWATNGNWDGCTVPTDGDTLVFPASPPSLSLNNDLIANTQIFGITISDGYTFTGNEVSLQGNVVNNSTTAVNFGIPIRLENNITISSDGSTTTLTGGIYVNGFDLTFDGSFDTTISTIGLDGGGNIIKNETGGFNLYAASLFNGTFTINQGTLRANDSDSFGHTDSVVSILSGSTFEIVGSANKTFTQNFILDNGALLTAAAGATGTYIFSDAVIIGDAGMTVDAATAASIEFSGNFWNNGPTGDVHLNGPITISGNTDTLDNGIYLDSGDIYFNSPGANGAEMYLEGGNLHGTGTVGQLNAVAGSGQIRPGNNGIGNFTTDTLNLASGVESIFELNGTTPAVTYDTLTANFAATVGGTLTLDIGYSATIGDSFVIVDNTVGGATAGTFTGLTEGDVVYTDGIVSFVISYVGGTGNDVEITVEAFVNTDPVITDVSDNPNTISENASIDVTVTFTDPDTFQTHDVQIDWGDGNSNTYNLSAGVLTTTQSHQYLDNPATNPFPISASVTDSDLGTDSGVDSVTVNNVAPTLTGNSLTGSGATRTLSGNITDPGTLDNFTITIVWDDGTSNTVLNLSAAANSFTANHTYSASGTYDVGFTIQDKDGGSNAYVLSTTVTLAGSSSGSTSSTSSDSSSASSIVSSATSSQSRISVSATSVATSKSSTSQNVVVNTSDSLQRALDSVVDFAVGNDVSGSLIAAATITAGATGIAAVATATGSSFSGILIGLFWPRRRKSWGIVYDASNLQPVPLAAVRLVDKGQTVVSTVSDLHGVYGLLADKLGTYEIVAEAGGYEPYRQQLQLYTYDAVEDVALVADQKQRAGWLKLLLRYRLLVLNFLRYGLMVLLLCGLTYTVFATIQTPSLLNALILCVYFLLSVPGLYVMIMPFFNQVRGKVVDESNGVGIAKVLVKLVGEDNQVSVITNSKGLIKVNLPPGSYMAVVSKSGYEVVNGVMSKAGVLQLQVEVDKNGGITQEIRLRAVGASVDPNALLDSPFGR